MLRIVRFACIAAAFAMSLATPAFAALADAPVTAAPFQLGAADRAALVAALERAPEHGLAPIPAAALDDAGLASAAVGYAEAMRGGRIAGRFPDLWALRPQPYDAAEAFTRAVATGRLQSWLDSLAPPQDGYRALVGALARYRAIEASGGWPQLAHGPTLKPGDRDPRVAALRGRIAVETDVRLDGADATLFDAPLAQLLRREQARLGVPVTGELDKATLAAFNVPVAARIDAIELNLERWRWLPRTLPAY
ncbi:MAG TPA: murein L,D-transpeptidase, partial [Caulobacteraceae bacterium]